MKLSIIILVVFCVNSICSTNTAVTYESGFMIPETEFIPQQAATFDCGTHIGALCSDDCVTLMACMGQSTPLFHQSCAARSKDTPYCVGNSCTSTPDSKNPKCGSSFVCTSEGIFPDPDDCTKYRACDAPMGTSILFQCPKDQVYFSETNMCRKKTSNSFCQKVDCSKTTNDWVVFVPNKAFYAFCLVDDASAKKTIMFKCIDDENFIFDLKTNECIYDCKKEGSFVDRLDCTKYITCTRVSGKYQITSESCPPNYFFDKNKCGRGTCTPEITTTQIPVTEPEIDPSVGPDPDPNDI